MRNFLVHFHLDDDNDSRFESIVRDVKTELSCCSNYIDFDDIKVIELSKKHDRLIEADEAIKRVARAFLDKPWGGMDFGLKVEEIIDNIPTVIKAEVE